MNGRDVLIALTALALSALLLWAGLAPGRPAVFGYPVLWSAVMSILALLLTLQAVGLIASDPPRQEIPESGAHRPGRALPGLAIMVVYVAVLETVGFYVSTWLAFVAMSTIYAPVPWGWQQVLRRLVIATLFVLTLYLLFTGLLSVRTPKGWLP